jgi:hypothetical protein
MSGYLREAGVRETGEHQAGWADAGCVGAGVNLDGSSASSRRADRRQLATTRPCMCSHFTARSYISTLSTYITPRLHKLQQRHGVTIVNISAQVGTPPAWRNWDSTATRRMWTVSTAFYSRPSPRNHWDIGVLRTVSACSSRCRASGAETPMWR